MDAITEKFDKYVDTDVPPPAYEEAPLPAPPPFEPSRDAKILELLKYMEKDPWTTENAIIPALVQASADDPADSLLRSILMYYQRDHKPWARDQFEARLAKEDKGNLLDSLWKALRAFKRETVLACAGHLDTNATHHALIHCQNRLYEAKVPGADDVRIREILDHWSANDYTKGIQKLKTLISGNPTIANMLYDGYYEDTKKAARKRCCI